MSLFLFSAITFSENFLGNEPRVDFLPIEEHTSPQLDVRNLLPRGLNTHCAHCAVDVVGEFAYIQIAGIFFKVVHLGCLLLRDVSVSAG